MPDRLMRINLPAEPLVGEHVLLRGWNSDDAEWYVAARDDEVFLWTTEPRDLDPAVLRRVIETNRSKPKWAGFAITDASTGELLGNVSLKPSKVDRQRAEASYWLAPAARGRGVATDAVATIVAWGFESLPIDGIDLLTNPENERSKGVARRTGFEPAGRRGAQLVFSISRAQ